LTSAVLELGCRMMREKPWTLFLLPLAVAIPAVTLANCAREFAFVYRWASRTCAPHGRAIPRWVEPQRSPEAGV
jgi:hypothetical protein